MLIKKMGVGSRERGYSLVEALVVMAIIGVISVVTVPNFVAQYRSFRFKASLRQFTTDIRFARQEAVSKNQWSRLSFVPGSAAYRILESNDAGSTWTTTAFQKTLGQQGFFHSSSTFTDVDSDADSSLDITFKNDGTLDGAAGTAVMRTSDDIPYNQFTVAISLVGKLTTTKAKY